MEQLKLDFYYGQEADQFTFYRLPKVLIVDKRFKDISDSAKLLYGLMLDRMSLSVRNGWFDEENRVYIKYSFASIMEDLNCAKEKASRLLKELEDIGLIWKVTRIGHASVIYVKNFVTVVEEGDDATDQFENRTGSETEQVHNRGNETYRTSTEIEPVRKTDKFENQTSSGTEIEQQVVRNSNTNNNNIIKTNISDNNNHIYRDEMDETCYGADDTIAYMNLIKSNIDYDLLMSDEQWEAKEQFDELYQLICEVVCVPRKTIRIGGQEFPYSIVKSQFLKLNAEHLKYVIGCMERNTSKVSNIKSYLITALFNAPSTMRNFYNAEVNYNMCGMGL